jgi:hypothetical protein
MVGIGTERERLQCIHGNGGKLYLTKLLQIRVKGKSVSCRE